MFLNEEESQLLELLFLIMQTLNTDSIKDDQFEIYITSGKEVAN
jgi:uncharacterized protein YqhQ